MRMSYAKKHLRISIPKRSALRALSGSSIKVSFARNGVVITPALKSDSPIITYQNKKNVFKAYKLKVNLWN